MTIGLCMPVPISISAPLPLIPLPETAPSSVEQYEIAHYLLQSCAVPQHPLAPFRAGTLHELVDEQNLHHQFTAELSAC